MTNAEKLHERKQMILAMEFICRQINDENVFERWLTMGVPDGDIEYGNFDTDQIDDNDTLIEDDNFKELMECFLDRMIAANKSGGLYCGDIVTRRQ